MHKFIVGLLVAVLTGVQLLVAAAGTETVPLQFLLVNDFHGHLRSETEAPGAAKLAATIEELRRENPEGTVLLGGGDMFAGTLDSNEFRGRPAIELMNALHFDGDVAGNHIFDFNRAVIARQALWAKFPLLAANIQDGTGKTAAPFVPGVLLERRGVRIGVVGLVTMDTPEKASKKNMQGLTFVAPVPAAAATIRTLRQQGAQLIVLLVHMSTYQDRAGKVTGGEIMPILAQLPEVDVLLSGHSHQVVAGTVNVHGKTIPVVQSGWAGNNVAVVRVQYDLESNKLLKTEPLMVRTATADGKLAEPLATRLQGYLTAVDKKYHTPLAVNDQYLPYERRSIEERACADVFLDLVRQEAGARVALCNGGAFRTGLPQGQITLADVLKVWPFKDSFYLADISGQVLKAAVTNGLETRERGLLRFSGLKVVGRVNGPAAGRISSITFSDGTPVEDNRDYRVVLNEFMLNGGDGYTMFQQARNRVKLGGEASYVKKALQQAGRISYQLDDRLTVTNASEAAAAR
jgi:5'-nucleotidase/UDP-sugar diphosphatase